MKQGCVPITTIENDLAMAGGGGVNNGGDQNRQGTEPADTRHFNGMQSSPADMMAGFDSRPFDFDDPLMKQKE